MIIWMLVNIYYKRGVDTVILTNNLSMSGETHTRTIRTSEQMTNDIDNEDAGREIDTETNVDMEVKLGKVSLNHDIRISL